MSEWDQSQNQPIIKIGSEHFRIPTAEECREIVKACDAFWQRRGKAPPSSGFAFLDFQKKNSEKNNSTDEEISEPAHYQ